MKVLNVGTIAEGHEAVVRLLLTDGDEIVTEDGELTFEYEEPVCIHVSRPWGLPKISDACNFGPVKMGEYVKQLTTLHPKTATSATYYYSNRLFDYPRAGSGDGDGNGINQIQTSIIERLLENNTSRRAIAITWVPGLDIESQEPPCVQLIQCLIRNNRLNMVVYIRSNDMLSAWGANAFGLTTMQDMICLNLKTQEKAKFHDLRVGWFETISASAHMYWRRDAEELKKFRRILNI